MTCNRNTAALLGALAGASIAGVATAGAQQAWSEADNDRVRAIVAETLADADARSSLLQDYTSVGHDGKFFLGDPDGNFRLNIGGALQFRYDLVFGDNLDNVADRDFDSGFQTTRTRLVFDGHVYEPNLYYYIQGDFSSDDGNFALLDAYVGYKFDNGWAIQWGQMKAPLLRETLVDFRYQLAANRSMMEAALSAGRTQGIAAVYAQEDFNFVIGFTDGARRANSDINSTGDINTLYQGAGTGEADYSITARGEFKLAGTWDQFRDFTSMPGSDYGAMIGVAGHFEGAGEDRLVNSGGGDVDSRTLFAWTVDAGIEGDGWNLFGAFAGFHSDALENYSDYAWLIQGGWFIPDSDWEIFGRFDQVIPDNDDGSRGLATGKSFNTITAGLNYYMHGHASKFTFQAIWYLNEDPALVGTNTDLPWLSNGMEDNEFALTFQWQLLF